MTFDASRVLKRYNQEELDAMLDYLLERATPREPPKPKLIHFAETIPAARQMMAEDGQMIGLSTGWSNIDAMFKGMRPGQLIVVYGETKHRKSIFVQNLAANVAQAGDAVLFIGLELIGAENTERWLTMGYDNLPIVYPEQTAPDYRDVDALVEVAVEQGIKLVVVDHLHMWQGEGPNQADAITKMVQEMKRVAMKHEVPLILVSHVSGDKTSSGPPAVNRLKGSTSIAQLADKVVCIYSRGVEYAEPDTEIEVLLPLSRRFTDKKFAKLNILAGARLAEPTAAGVFSP